MTISHPPAPPPVRRPELDVPDAMEPSCTCEDKDLDRLRALMAKGIPQWEASRILWSPTVPPGQTVAVQTPGAWATRFVRAVLTARLPWLRLPTPTEVS